MAPFTCKCENKSYSGWFNNKKCKDCDTIIHFRKIISIGSHQWKTQRIEDLEQGSLSDYRIRFKSAHGVSKAYEIRSVEEMPNQTLANGNTGAHKITFKKDFGSDVSITTLDGSYGTAVANLAVLLNKFGEVPVYTSVDVVIRSPF